MTKKIRPETTPQIAKCRIPPNKIKTANLSGNPHLVFPAPSRHPTHNTKAPKGAFFWVVVMGTTE
jgi:hypothetical protein